MIVGKKIFFVNILNKDISVNIVRRAFIFYMCIPEIETERKVSQMFDIGLTFDFIKCRILYFKKVTKSYPPSRRTLEIYTESFRSILSIATEIWIHVQKIKVKPKKI